MKGYRRWKEPYRYFDGVTVGASIYNKLGFSVFICLVQRIGIFLGFSSHNYEVISYFALSGNDHRNIPGWFFVGVGDLDLGGSWNTSMTLGKYLGNII